MPHENRDLLAARVPANLTGLNSYRNGQGAFFRGGDVWMRDSMSVVTILLGEIKVLINIQ